MYAKAERASEQERSDGTYHGSIEKHEGGRCWEYQHLIVFSSYFRAVEISNVHRPPLLRSKDAFRDLQQLRCGCLESQLDTETAC